MDTYYFTVRLDRVPNDEEQNALDDTGLDDGSLVISGDGQHASIMMSRTANNLDEAIVTTLANIRTAQFTPVGIANEDTVDLAAIARRTGRTHESVRLLAKGERGSGGFPKPVIGNLYSWAQVRHWFADYEGATPSHDVEADTLAAADLLLRAKLLRPNPGRLATLITA